ncbi:C39 family peptidase [Kitasatospora sp. NPDC054939]
MPHTPPGDRPDVLHAVPYYAQWESPELVRAIVTGAVDAADDPRWGASGARTPEEYAWWSWRLCGVACLRMALDHWWGVLPTTMRLARECEAAGAYVREGDRLRGLRHEPFAGYLRERWGLAARPVPAADGDALAAELAGGRLVVLSVHPGIREPEAGAAAPAGAGGPRRAGHLVLAVGAGPAELVIHNPSGYPGESQAYARVPWDLLDHWYAGRGIVLGPPPGVTG